MAKQRIAAVIVAAGTGSRAGGELPKQYQLIGGRPVIWWTVKAFLDHPDITHVQVVTGDGHERLFAAATQGLALPPPVIGGGTRQDSCRSGVEACAAHRPDLILIHDAARPFLSADLITDIIAALARHDGVVPGLAVADTMKFAPHGVIERTVDRSHLWVAQTPQGFRYDAIRRAHQRALDDDLHQFTDDAAVAEHAGLAVALIAGRLENRKLTTAEDISVADRQLMGHGLSDRPDIRMGQGIDFHQFEAGDSVILCGVAIPHTQKLKGHSDADAALHALTDALLGTLGEGDIGTHFPPSDPQWKGAASAVFLAKAMALITARNGIIANVDITILAEAPKVAPHIPAMKAFLGPLLHLTPDRIAIKATTTEKMGAIGRGQGIAAFATATVRLP